VKSFVPSLRVKITRALLAGDGRSVTASAKCAVEGRFSLREIFGGVERSSAAV